MAKTNVELAQRGYEAALRGDLEAVREFLDPEVKWHGGDPSDPAACHNREQALEFMQRAGDRQGVGELVDIVGVGDKVVVVTRSLSPDDSDTGDLSANLTTFRDGKAVEMVHYAYVEDALAALRS